jgi:hypothetical protein
MATSCQAELSLSSATTGTLAKSALALTEASDDPEWSDPNYAQAAIISVTIPAHDPARSNFENAEENGELDQQGVS